MTYIIMRSANGVDPETGTIMYERQINSGTQLDFTDGVKWSSESGRMNMGATYRRINYSARINYARKFGVHDVGAMGLVQEKICDR